MSIKCSKHPKYRGIRKVSRSCIKCKIIRGLYRIHQACRKAEPAARPAVENDIYHRDTEAQLKHAAGFLFIGGPVNGQRLHVEPNRDPAWLPGTLPHTQKFSLADGPVSYSLCHFRINNDLHEVYVLDGYPLEDARQDAAKFLC